MTDSRSETLEAEAQSPTTHSIVHPPIPPGGSSVSTSSTHRVVWALAWPSVLTMLLQTFNSLMDTLFVGHLPHSAQALAATGAGGQVIFLLISLAMGVSVGTTALVARFTGADEPEKAVRATAQSLSLSLFLGTFCFMLFFGLRRWIVSIVLGGGSAISSAILCEQFLSLALLATVPNFLLNVLVGAFRGLGDTRTPLQVQAIMIAVHISFNWILIYGHLGFPALGVRGAGAALAISIFIGTGLYILALVRFSPLGEAMKQALRVDLHWYRRILRIGIPASVQAVIRTLGMMSFTGLLAHSSEASSAVAALQIGIRAEAIAFMPGFGYSVAAAALVGQSLGARDPDLAERYAWAATWQAVGVMSLMATGFYLFATPLSSLFTNDLQVVALGADYLRVNAICEPFVALGMVLTGALQGAGDTIRPTFITFLTMWALRLPLGWWLMYTFNLQSHGAWISTAITAVLGGVLTLGLFAAGSWKRIKV